MRGNKMKKKTKYAIIIIAIFLFVVFLARGCVLDGVRYVLTKQFDIVSAFPHIGTYICEDSGYTILIEDSQTYFINDEKQQLIHIGYGNRLLFGDGIVAFYSWDQKNDKITVWYSEDTIYFDNDEKYIFVRYQ